MKNVFKSCRSLFFVFSLFQTTWATPTPYEVSTRIAEIHAICRRGNRPKQIINWCSNEHNLACFEQFTHRDKVNLLNQFVIIWGNCSQNYSLDIKEWPSKIIAIAPQIYLQVLQGPYQSLSKIFGNYITEGIIKLMIRIADQQADLINNFVQICKKNPTLFAHLIREYPSASLSKKVISCLQKPEMNTLNFELCSWIEQKLTNHHLQFSAQIQTIYTLWLRQLSPENFQIWLNDHFEQFCNALISQLHKPRSFDLIRELDKFADSSSEQFLYVFQQASRGEELMQLFHTKVLANRNSQLRNLGKNSSDKI